MARQTITPAEVTGPWPSTASNNGGVALVETAANATDKEQMKLTGRELLIARNAGATPRVVTITSVPDPETGRSGDITESVPAGEMYVLGPFAVQGFKQTDGNIYFEAAHSDIKWSAIRK